MNPKPTPNPLVRCASVLQDPGMSLTVAEPRIASWTGSDGPSGHCYGSAVWPGVRLLGVRPISSSNDHRAAPRRLSRDRCTPSSPQPLLTSSPSSPMRTDAEAIPPGRWLAPALNGHRKDRADSAVTMAHTARFAGLFRPGHRTVAPGTAGRDTRHGRCQAARRA